MTLDDGQSTITNTWPILHCVTIYFMFIVEIGLLDHHRSSLFILSMLNSNKFHEYFIQIICYILILYYNGLFKS